MKYDMARIRLNLLHRSRQKLKDFAINTIVNNLRLYISLPEYKSQLISLPGNIREDVLMKLSPIKNSLDFGADKMLQQTFLLKEVVPLLLSKETRVFKMHRLLSQWSHQSIDFCATKIVSQIATFAPQIHSLEVSDPVLSRSLWNETLLNSVFSLQKLKKLSLSFHVIPFEDVLKIGKSIASLRKMSIQFVNLTTEPLDLLEIKRSLRNLSVFEIIPYGPKWIKMELLRFCIENFPNLEIVGGDITMMDQYDILRSGCDLKFSETSKLRHMFVILKHREIPFAAGDLHLKFPNITHLKIKWSEYWTHDEREINAMLCFSQVEFLILDSVPSAKNLKLFLAAYGRNLLTLHLENSVEMLQTYGSILCSCPKLETLRLSRLELKQNFELLPISAELRVLQVYFPKTSCGMLLSNILPSVPKLEEVCLWGELNVEDLATTSRLIAKRKILQNLKRCIVKNIALFACTEEVSRLLNLACDLRNLVIETLVELKCIDANGDLPQFMVLLKALWVLLNVKTRIFKFGWLMSHCPLARRSEGYLKVLNIIIRCAPFVEVLIIDARNAYLTRRDQITQDIVDEILYLECLHTLEINSLIVSYVEVMTFGYQLPFLEVLRVDNINFEDADLSIDDIKENFSNLKIFQFNSFNRRYVATRNMLIRLCIEHIPNLEVVGDDVDSFGSFEGYDDRLPAICPFLNLTAFELQHLCTSSSQIFLTPFAFLHFPRVTHLKIKWESNDEDSWTSLLNFRNISCLSLEAASFAKILNQFLTVYGSNLKSLHLTGKGSTLPRISFGQIFNTCEKLEKLTLNRVIMRDARETILSSPLMKEMDLWIQKG
ncbi:Hypothetical predicted protein [Cloeon dipterum]|uniref:Uncharacterized protein n=1 Tax=Cloeon dipterum TaxID=197152 RepID=A0A8S1D7W8_9INSE|nr:Hypothetical predicted protein [Cloeon dipterum]